MRTIGVAQVRRALSAAYETGGELVRSRLSGRPGRARRPLAVLARQEASRTVSVGRTAADLYQLWRAPGVLARVLPGAEITELDADRTRWRVQAFGRGLEWETRVVEDRPGELIRWESAPGGQMRSAGFVRFAPAPPGWGTEVTLCLSFGPPEGAAADATGTSDTATDADAGGTAAGPAGVTALPLGLAHRVAVPTALRRFKSLAETGEIPTLDDNPSARGARA